jgi:hypothetical protein
MPDEAKASVEIGAPAPWQGSPDAPPDLASVAIMTKTDARPPAALGMLWRRWLDVVASFANRNPGRMGLDAVEYEALHSALVGACQALAAKADAGGRAWYDGVLQVVRPWLNVGSLAQADQELLADLLARCRIIDEELTGCNWSKRLRRQRLLVALGAACFLLPPLLVAVMYWSELPLADFASGGWRWMRSLWRSTGGLDFWFAGGGLLTMAFVFWGLWAVSRPRRGGRF